MAPTIDVRRADSRYKTRTGWLDSHHSFSFDQHYHPDNTHHGLVLVSNDDVVKPGSGFMTHPHQDMEIVTWVLERELEHQDTLGNKGIIYPGLAQRMSAGTGIWHSEMNPSGDAPVHFVHMWVLPDTERIDPGYEQFDINPQLERGGLVPIASGRGHEGAISIRQARAALWGGRLSPGETIQAPDGSAVHVFVARGAVELESAGGLAEGDAVRLTNAGGRLTADPVIGAEILIWEMA